MEKIRKRIPYGRSKLFKWKWLCHYKLLHEESQKMKEKLMIHYDEEGDLLEIRMGKPTDAYYEDLGDDIFERIDRKTKKVKGLAIFNFRKRNETETTIDVELPIKMSLTN